MDTIFACNEERMLGCLPREAAPGTVCPLFKSRYQAIPRDKWQEVSWRHLIRVVLNQGSQGSCVGATGAGAMMALRAAVGLEHKLLSIGSLYGQINQGRDQGALMGDSMKALMSTGMCPVDVIPHYTWQMRSWPSNWKQIAKEYRALEAYDCSDFDELVTAIQRGFVVNYGITIGRTFEPNSEGIIAPRRDSAGGHAMLGIGVKQFNGIWHVETLNSWSETWGLGGRAYVPESYFVGRSSYMDAWALRAVVISGDTNIPQLV
jgi:hypothetical protein